ncbi:hypothetical protein BJX61DRAFT_505354 [Aspergillus egyptiacus]|nr:hypothetical protein BJX61DRAFT_505354 [Aspergillus egyptiacus]
MVPTPRRGKACEERHLHVKERLPSSFLPQAAYVGPQGNEGSRPRKLSCPPARRYSLQLCVHVKSTMSLQSVTLSTRTMTILPLVIWLFSDSDGIASLAVKQHPVSTTTVITGNELAQQIII